MFLNRVRLPLYFSKPQFPIERSVFKRADGSRKVLSAVVSNTYEGKTDDIPKEWHQRLAIALSHDVVNIESDRLLTEVVMESEYGIDWQEFLDFPIAKANFTVNVTPFNASNSNCQTCDEITQLELVDDTTEDCFEEGTTNEFPFSVLLNDSICCYPFTLEIVSFNTTYFSAVSITDAGIVTFTLQDETPSISNVLLATYRVTCPNGAYDEANIYVCIEGTSTECVAPQNVILPVLPNGDNATISWDAVIPTPAGYNWALYDADDIYTILQSGSTTDTFITVTGLTPGETYVFAVQTDCGDGTSSWSTVEFTITDLPENLCGNFMVSYDPTDRPYTGSYTYMDCSGEIQNGTLISFDAQPVCMLINEGETNPILFTADPGISISYIGLC